MSNDRIEKLRKEIERLAREKKIYLADYLKSEFKVSCTLSQLTPLAVELLYNKLSGYKNYLEVAHLRAGRKEEDLLAGG